MMTLKNFILAFFTITTSALAQSIVVDDSTVHANPVLAITNTGCGAQVIVQSSIGFEVGDRVLIHQAKGMLVSSVIADSGSMTEIGHTGNFELATIASIQGTTVGLASRLVRLYDVSKKVQLVKAIFGSSIEIRGQIEAQPWNGDCGGVVVIEATDSLLLTGSINVNGAGFQGGSASSAFPSCGVFTDIYASWPSDRYGQKGEGASTTIPAIAAGIGRSANGGGGGGNHNSGGGGGGNGSRGGMGGATYDVCGVILNGGRGGGECPQELTAPRLFFGGGGGGGHQNEGRGTGGARGGGCVLIVTPVLHASGLAGVAANGSSAAQSHQDGAGGGGAGGTVLLAAESIAGFPTISIRGGDGGRMSSSTGRHGPGGGGSGGQLLVLDPTYGGASMVDLAGGKPGNQNGDTNDTWYASPGGQGHIVYDCVLPVQGGTGSNQERNLLLGCTTHGSAFFSRDTLRLTDDIGHSAGAAWTKEGLNLSAPFTMDFSFRMTNGTDSNLKDNGPEGADGIAVVFAGGQTKRVGTPGQGIGYDGLTNCVVVEFDAYLNAQNSDPGASHIAVQSSPTSITASHRAPDLRGMTADVPPLRGDGTVYYARIQSTGSALNIFLSETPNFTSPNLVLGDFTFSQFITLGANAMGTLGITSATGFSVQTHDILSWGLGSCDSLLSSVDDMIPENTALTIRPNPAGDYIVVGPWTSSQSGVLEIIDMTGRVCMSTQVDATEEITVSLNAFQSGVYIVRVVDDNKVYQELLHVIR